MKYTPDLNYPYDLEHTEDTSDIDQIPFLSCINYFGSLPIAEITEDFNLTWISLHQDRTSSWIVLLPLYFSLKKK